MRLLLAPLLLLALQQQPADVQRETYPDGRPRAERELGRDARGQPIVQGAAKEWFENGQLAAKGRYTAGLKHGVWEAWHENGARASKGRFERGAREGQWSFWDPQGAQDLERSGEYELERVPTTTGGVRSIGYRVDGRRQGVWRFLWPDGRLQFTGRYRNGVREGPWVFFHQDGSHAPLLLSGLYAGGVRSRAMWPNELDVYQPPQEEGLEVEPPRKPSESPALALPVDWNAPLEFLESVDLADAKAVKDLIKASPPVLATLGCEKGFGWTRSTTPSGLAQRQEYVRSLRSLWELKRGDPVFWWIDLQAPPAERDALVTCPPLLIEDRPGYSEGRLTRDCFVGRFAESRPHQESVAAALSWLARHQRADGSWRTDGFMQDGGAGSGCACDGAGERGWHVGLTALALLAFLGDGHTPYRGEHSAVVAGGIGFLLRSQDSETGSMSTYLPTADGGRISAISFLYEHSLATYVLAEAAALTGNPVLEQRLAPAVGFLLKGRNPDAAWRYAVPANGDNDTSVTAWAVQALRAAEVAGVDVDPDAYQGALAWIDQMTDPETGRCGYTERGSVSARLEAELERFPGEASEALTAAALLVRLLIDQDRSAPILAQQAELLSARRPVWEIRGGGIDFYYWFYGAQAMHQMGDARWMAALEAAVVAPQRTDGDFRGSWDPVDAWSSVGGRVYATAILALALEGPSRSARSASATARRR